SDGKERDRQPHSKRSRVAAKEHTYDDLRDRRLVAYRSDRCRVECVKISEVCKDINDDDQHRASDDSEWDISARFFNFACDERQVVPTVVAPECTEHCGCEARGE